MSKNLFIITPSFPKVEKWHGVEFPMQDPHEKVTLSSWLDRASIRPEHYEGGDVYWSRADVDSRVPDPQCVVVQWMAWGSIRDNPLALHEISKQLEALKKRVEDAGMLWEYSIMRSDNPEYFEFPKDERPVRAVVFIVRTK